MFLVYGVGHMLEHATEVTTDCIHFCTDSVIPKKTIKVFPNSKIKDRKKLTFKNNDQLLLRATRSELNQRLKEAKQQHRKLWDSVKTMTNMKPTKKPIYAKDELSTANELKHFTAESNSILENIPTDGV